MKDAATKHPKSSCFAFDSKQHVGFASRSPSATISLHATVATCCNSHLTREYCCHTCVVSVARPSVIPAFTDAIGEFSHICGPNCVALHRNFLTFSEFENECDADRNSRTLLDPRPGCQSVARCRQEEWDAEQFRSFVRNTQHVVIPIAHRTTREDLPANEPGNCSCSHHLRNSKQRCEQG